MDTATFASTEQPLRLLLVEDSEDDALLLLSELELEGVRTRHRRVDTEDGMRALLARDEWDIVISDHAMPCFSAAEALRVLKESGKDIPFIIYSNAIPDRIAVDVMRQGVQDCVRKGNFKWLIPAVERELRSAAMRREKTRAESHVFHLAYYDELTGLPNRNLFCEQVDRALAAQPDQEAVLALIDLDRFIRINNTYGYGIGDVIIRKVVQRLQGCLRNDELLARFRGDDFVVFRSGAGGREAAADLADRVIESFKPSFTHGELEFFLKAAVGLCLYPEGGADSQTLLRNAELAVATAKYSCNTAHVLYDGCLGNASTERLGIEMALRHAVERGELILHYQPAAEIESGRVLGCEALVRWQCPGRGLVPPDKFIPVADETGLIIGIGHWVLREACRQMRAWHENGYAGLTVSVNVSAVQFAQPQLVHQVKEALEETGFDPAHLELELTESVLMRDVDMAIATLRQLKDMGVRIAVDDFGTGYSSLAYLKKFPIDVIKIDKAFTRDMTFDRDSAAIVGAVSALAKGLRLTTQAEGVETEEQLALLRRMLCDRMQGYLLSRPLPAAAAADFLAARCRRQRMRPRLSLVS